MGAIRAIIIVATVAQLGNNSPNLVTLQLRVGSLRQDFF